jgi:ketosteroid isomerase-like protein
MSEENVEVVRRFIDAINRRDVDAWAAAVAPELEFQSLFAGIEGRTYRGPESGRRYFGDLGDAWDTFHVEIEETADLGGDRVLVSVRYQGRGRQAGPTPRRTCGALMSFGATRSSPFRRT